MLLIRRIARIRRSAHLCTEEVEWYLKTCTEPQQIADIEQHLLACSDCQKRVLDLCDFAPFIQQALVNSWEKRKPKIVASVRQAALRFIY